MKNSHRLDYSSLIEVLGQRGLVDPQRLKIVLQSVAKSPIALPEMLVSENLIGDWELSRVVCELYGLPFLTVDQYPPSPAALDGLDRDFFRRYALVPLARHGQILTVCMPAMVPADVLGALAASSDLHVLPVVGTVNSNNRWLAEHLAVDAAPEAGEGAGWSKLFDESDAAVLLDLNDVPGSDPSQGEAGGPQSAAA